MYMWVMVAEKNDVFFKVSQNPWVMYYLNPCVGIKYPITYTYPFLA